MRWPYVSRRAYDLVLDERDRMRLQVDNLLDHWKRVDRIDRGVSEIPRQPRPPIEPMPDDLLEYINGFANKEFCKMRRDTAYRRHHKQGESWDAIKVDIMKEDELHV